MQAANCTELKYGLGSRVRAAIDAFRRPEIVIDGKVTVYVKEVLLRHRPDSYCLMSIMWVDGYPHPLTRFEMLTFDQQEAIRNYLQGW